MAVDQLANVTTADSYEDVATISQSSEEYVAASVQISGAAVEYQVETSPGDWTSDTPSGPIVGTLALGTCYGIKFRSLAAGQPAQVVCVMLTAEQVAAAGGLGQQSAPSYVLDPSGGVTPIATGGLAVFVGQIIELAGANPDPTRLVPCDGALYLKTDSTYAALNTYLAASGYPYGSDANHFNVPDKRERVAIGAGNNNALGSNEGVAEANRHGTRHRTSLTDPGHVHAPNPSDLQGLAASVPHTINSGGGSGLPDVGYAPANAAAHVTGITVGSGVGTDPLDGPAFLTTAFYIVYAT